MTILSDKQIKQLCTGDKPMIAPFVPYQVKQVKQENWRGVISYGLSSYGYDFRISGGDVKVFTAEHGGMVDPKAFDKGLMRNAQIISRDYGDYFILPPHSFALAHTTERWNIPRDVITVCLGKSTYARCGLILNVTPFEPEWEGHATLEISNTTPLPAKIYVNEGIGQLLFFRGDEPCEVSYADKKGKYQGQPARVEVARV